MDAYVVIAGNPVEGMTFYGPFESPEEAGEWAESNHRDLDWWVASLEPK